MERPLELLLLDRLKPNHLAEVDWLLSYLNDPARASKFPIFLSLGQAWEKTPSTLIAKMLEIPAFTHGYGLSMYGYPPLRRTLCKYVEEQYGLNPTYHKEYRLYEVAVAQTGTRSCLYNFAAWLNKYYVKDNAGILFTFAPSWDYGGIFNFWGYEVRYWDLMNTSRFLPDVDLVLEQLRVSLERSEKPVVALNIQHNPTGINWQKEIVEPILAFCVEHQLPLILDDAYFAICDPSVVPTSSHYLFLDLLSRMGIGKYPWLGVRSLGKQFCCNGWGIGIISAHPEILDELVNQYQTIHHYNINGVFQYAMNEWMNMPESVSFLTEYNLLITTNREIFKKGLIERLGYPESLFPNANTTYYQMFPVPPAFSETGTSQFTRLCLNNAGVLFSDAWPLPYNDRSGLKKYNYARSFLGTEREVLEEALQRMVESELFYE